MNSCNQYMDLPDSVLMQWHFTVFKIHFYKKNVVFFFLSLRDMHREYQWYNYEHQQWLRVVYTPLRNRLPSEAWKKTLMKQSVYENLLSRLDMMNLQCNSFSAFRKKHCAVCDFSLIPSVNVGMMVIWIRTRHNTG